MTEKSDDTEERDELDEWLEESDRRNFELDDGDSDGSGGNLIMDGEAQYPFAEADETDDGDD